MGQPVLSGPICAHGTRVLFRTTRQVKLTNGGPELLACSSISLDDFAAAAAAVRAVALGQDAAAQVGITRQECPRQPSLTPVPGETASIAAATIEAS